MTQISAWAENRLIKCNASKSKALTVSVKIIKIIFNNTLLDTVTKRKHFGIGINSNLSWKDQVTTICKHESIMLNILATLKTLVDRKTLTAMYHLLYYQDWSMAAYCPATVQGLKTRFSNQFRAFKVVTSGIVRTPTINLYNEVGFETLKARRDRNALLFLFTIINGMVPDYLQELRKSKPGCCVYRNKDDFEISERRLRKYLNSFLPYSVSLWNNLDKDTRTITTYEIFNGTLMANVNDNPVFHLGTRQDQIITVKLRMRSSNFKGHGYCMKIVESACSCGFINEDEFHFFLVCPLYNRPTVTLLNALAYT